jgi:hypothetical protein
MVAPMRGRAMLVGLVLLSAGCRARSPFDVAGAKVGIARLASFEGKAGEPIPAPIERWLADGASGLPADLVPPGLVVSGTPLPHFAPDAPRFLGFHEIDTRPVPDAWVTRTLEWAERARGAQSHAECMYPEFGIRVTHARGDGARVLVSLACKSVRIAEDSGATEDDALSDAARADFVTIAKGAYRVADGARGAHDATTVDVSDAGAAP